MSNYTNGEALGIIENEGTGYAVQDYADAERFEDATTAALWAEAAIALGKLETHLSKGVPDSEFDRTADVVQAEEELRRIKERNA